MMKRLFIPCLMFEIGFSGIIAQAENPLPAVVLADNMPVLQVPEGLKTYIHTKFPDLRIPGPSDMSGEWATYRGKKTVPYGCWGDFNGDGLTDIALILLGPGYWRALAFHQQKDGTYVALRLEEFPGPSDQEYTQEHAAQNFYLFVVKAGQPLSIGEKPIADTVYKQDAVALFMLKDTGSGILYQWTAVPDSKTKDFRLYGFYLASAWGDFTD